MAIKFLFYFILLPWLLKAQETINPNDLIIDQIACSGNATTSCDLIQKEIYLNAGDKINEDELANSKIRLQLKNLFKSVNITMRKGSERGHVDVVVEVEEANPFFTETEIQSHQSENSATNAMRFTVGHRNLFGTGKILQATGLYSKPQQDGGQTEGSIEYIDPNILGSKKLYFGIKVSQSKIEPYESCAGFCTGMTNQIKYSGTLGYRVLNFSYFSITSEIADTTVRQYSDYFSDVESKWRVKTNTYTYGWNTEDDTYFPTMGDKFELSLYRVEASSNLSPKSDASEYSNNGANGFYKKNWQLMPRHFLSASIFDNEDLRSYGSRYTSLPVEYSYQFQDDKNGGISRSRLSFQAIPTSFKYTSQYGSESYDNHINANIGYKFEHKKFGIVKFLLTYWGR